MRQAFYRFFRKVHSPLFSTTKCFTINIKIVKISQTLEHSLFGLAAAVVRLKHSLRLARDSHGLVAVEQEQRKAAREVGDVAVGQRAEGCLEAITQLAIMMFLEYRRYV